MAKKIAVFRYSAAKVPIIFGFFLLLTILFFWAAVQIPYGRKLGDLQEYYFYFCAAISAFITVLIMPKLFQKGPILEITTQGIRDRRLSPDFLSWASVSKISIYKLRFSRSLQLRLLPDARSKLKLTSLARIFYFGPWDFSISMAGLDGTFDDLLRAVRRASGRKIS